MADRVRSEEPAFAWYGRTTPRDLELQLQLLAAYVTDPGYRPEGEVQYRQDINNRFAQLRATPFSALNSEIGGILFGTFAAAAVFSVPGWILWGASARLARRMVPIPTSTLCPSASRR